MTSLSAEDDELMLVQSSDSQPSAESSRLHLDSSKVAEQRLQSEQVDATQKAAAVTEQLKALNTQLKSQAEKCSSVAQTLSTETQQYQYRFSAVLMQNVMNELIHIQSRSAKSALIKGFVRWRQAAAFKTMDPRLKILANSFGFTVNRLVQALDRRVNREKTACFNKIRAATAIQRWEANWSLVKVEEDKAVRRRTQEANVQLAALQQKRGELEAFIEELAQKEKTYKEEIKHLTEEKKADSARVASLQTQPRRSSRSRARDLAERVQDLEEENRDLRDKVDSMEANVTAFLKEMSSLLDHSSYQGGQGEEGHGSEEERRPIRGR
jgi:predicted  nucleic acid-binding Zn-ribbon protein